MVSFWGLNIGLMGMIVVTLVPVGVMQALESFNNGFWSARSMAVYEQPVVKTLLWLRMFPDTVFIVAGAIPLVAACVYGLFHMRSLQAPVPVEAKKEEAREMVGV
jgi:nitric oxide reductase subunit B